jgi:hypothetical protein
MVNGLQALLAEDTRTQLMQASRAAAFNLSE